MKLSNVQKMQRDFYLQEFRFKGGKIFRDSFSGLTVCVKPALNVPNPKFFYVSTAQCDFVDDGFKRKRGEFIALERMHLNMCCTVPANGREIDDIGMDSLEFFAMD
jgi:hypothetical protein